MFLERNRTSHFPSSLLRRTTFQRLSAIALAIGLLGLVVPPVLADEPAQKKIGIEAIDEFIASAGISKADADWKSNLPRPPKTMFKSSKKYFWMLKTNVGMIKVELLAETAPMHVTSTIYLTKIGFYDNVKFHRVISGFMAQGGDPTGTGRGGPGYQYGGEFAKGVGHDAAGTLSMANSGPNTDGSQFFLTFTKTPHLDGKHTVFGRVVEGMGTVRQLEQNGSRGGIPKIDLFIEQATIYVE